MPGDTAASFDNLGLTPRALAAVERLGWKIPTPIQLRAIPPAMEGKDVVGCAATGTGKTAAFLLPILERLEPGQGVKALILAPTRELVLQIAEQLDELGGGGKIRGVTIIGGVGMEPQIRGLREGCEVVVATPGRLIDHLERGSAKLGTVEVLILDEADRMLDMGFKPQLERILRKLPHKRQTMLFSATMAGEVAEFAQKHLKTPVKVEVARSGTTAARAVQRVYLIPQEQKTALLMALLAEDEKSTLVFTRTKRRADRVARSLERAGLEVSRIHADRSQGQRRQALEGFKSGKHRVLVATDIAARGIDVEEIGHVVIYDLPHIPEDYVHRIGRTARAAASGLASTFCSPDEADLLRDIEKLTRTLVPRAEVPRHSVVFQEELGKRADRQQDPGPQRPGHGVSSRPAGQAPGRHAMSHPKRPKPVTGQGAGGGGGGGTRRPPPRSPGQGQGAGAGGPPVKVGSWRPKKRK